jgi:acetyl-CoA carboxylase biotin carboxyl carrier protein
LDLNDIKELLQIIDEKEFAEFELEQDGIKLRVRKIAPAAPPVVVATPVPVAPLVSATLAGAAPVAGPAGESGPPAEAASDEKLIRSPIVGTFYRAPDPNSAPFVSVGDRVKVGQVLCIVEAMKLMNEIEAELAGEIVKIHKENGQPVQYGEPLFSVR